MRTPVALEMALAMAAIGGTQAIWPPHFDESTFNFGIHLTCTSELSLGFYFSRTRIVERFGSNVRAVRPRDGRTINKKFLEVVFVFRGLKIGPVSHGSKSITFFVPSLNFTSIR